LTTEESIEEDVQNVKADDGVFFGYVGKGDERDTVRPNGDYLTNRIFLFSLFSIVRMSGSPIKKAVL